MEIRERITGAYLDYVLTNGKQPPTVFAFAKQLDMPEREFYTYFSSFNALEASIWEKIFVETKEIVESQEVWAGYTVREKLLSFFYSFTEQLKGSRSFAMYSAGKHRMEIGTPTVLSSLKKRFYTFALGQISIGIESGELSDRKYLTSRYTDALWVQFMFLLNFWLRDTSTGFEKTDEAIEKGLNVTFDLMSRLPVENILDYGKFIFRNAGRKL